MNMQSRIVTVRLSSLGSAKAGVGAAASVWTAIFDEGG